MVYLCILGLIVIYKPCFCNFLLKITPVTKVTFVETNEKEPGLW